MHLVNVLQSALGMVKSLLPVTTGGGLLPVAPKLPDVPSFLDNLSSMLDGILGTSSPSPQPAPEVPPAVTSPQAPVVAPSTTSVPPTSVPTVLVKSDDQILRDREEAQREAARRSDAEAPGDSIVAQLEAIRRIVQGLTSPGPAGSEGKAPSGTQTAAGSPAPTIKDLLAALEELKQRAGISQGNAPVAQAPKAGVPETAPIEVQPPVGTPVAAKPNAPTVVLPASSVPAVELPKASPPLAGIEAPGLAAISGTPAKGDALPPAGRLSDIPAAVPDPTTVAPATWMAAVTPIIVESVTPEAVDSVDGPGAARQEPTAEVVAGPGPVGSGASIVSSAPEAPTSETGPDLVDRIVQAAKLTQSRGASRIKIALDPPNLGELKVDLSVRDRVLHGSLQAESPAAKEMLLSHLQSLKDSLAEQGIQVGEFQVNVDPSFQQAAQQQSGDGQPRSGGGSSSATAISEDPAGSVQDRIRSARMQMIDMVA